MNSKSYRTKMEYAIFVDENELFHLAQHIPGTKRALVITDTGSELALPGLNKAALYIIKILNQKGVENPSIESRISKRQLKGIMVRYSKHEDKSVCYLFIKDEKLGLDAKDFFDEQTMRGVFIYYSTEKSPAYVQTKLISSVGTKDLTEKLNNIVYKFPSDGFFQINIPIVEEFLEDAYNKLKDLPLENRKLLVDLYAGVGTIGIYVGKLFKEVCGVEYFPGSKSYAMLNAKTNDLTNYSFIESKSEDIALNKILDSDSILFLDPPRAGLMPKVTKEILEILPKYIYYLSCNPQTQSRDIDLIKDLYTITFTKEYDFFHNTKHLERFIILERKL